MSTLFVVPTLGERHAYLAAALASIASQRIDDLDLVVVAPRNLGVEAQAAAAGARFVPDPGAGGLSGALNAGLAAARADTEWFGWLGDDDLLAPGSLTATRHALLTHPDVVLVYGWCDYIDAAGRTVFRSRAGRLAAAILPYGPNLVPQPGSLMRFDAVVEVGCLDPAVGLAMDLDLFLRLRRVGELLALRRTVASFRWHPDSATVRSGQASMEESDRVRMRYLPGPLVAPYRVLRWPGRWALAAAKRRVSRATARTAAAAEMA